MLKTNTKTISTVLLLVSNVVFILLAIYNNAPLFAIVAGYIWQSSIIIFFSVLRLHRNYTLSDAVLHPKKLPVVFSNEDGVKTLKKMAIFILSFVAAGVTVFSLFYYQFVTLIFSFIFDAQQSSNLDTLLPDLWQVISPFNIGILLLFLSHLYSFSKNNHPSSNSPAALLVNVIRVICIASASYTLSLYMIKQSLNFLPEGHFEGNQMLIVAAGVNTLPYAIALMLTKIVIDLTGHHLHHNITGIIASYKTKHHKTTS